MTDIFDDPFGNNSDTGPGFWSDMNDFGFSDDFNVDRAGNDTDTFQDDEDDFYGFGPYKRQPVTPYGHLTDFNPGRQLSEVEVNEAAHHWPKLHPAQVVHSQTIFKPWGQLAGAIRALLHFLGF